LFLWRQVLDERRELTWWERIRRAVSLVLTVAIALALALAVTRPALRSGSLSVSRGRMFIVIDSSWSMLARTRGGGSRWDRAVAEARRLAGAGAGDEIALATTADGLVAGPTTDVTLVLTALDRLAAAGGDVASWPQLAGADSVHFITDGALARPVAPEVIVHSVFEPADNVAITALDVRPALAGADGGHAYLEIANFAASPQKVHLTLTRGTASVLDRELDLSAGETLRQVVPLSRGTDPALRAHLDAPRNALAMDDEAFAWIEHANPLSVTIVGGATTWLRPLVAGDPDVRARFVDPAGYAAAQDPPATPGPDDRADLVIFDRWAPVDPPAIPAIMIAPPVETAWLSRRQPGEAADPLPEKKPRWEVVGPHPVVRGVDPLTLIIERAHAYGSAALVPVAQSRQGTPLVYVDEAPARRLVVTTFGPGDSNLASAPAFPVLMGNAMDWLVRRETRHARSAGLATFGRGVVRVTDPTGAQVPLARVGEAAIGLLRSPGFYVADEGGATSTFAVNVGDPQMSNVGRSTLTGSGREHTVVAGGSGRPWWVYCAALAFAMAVTEWWAWQRRITV
jgi:hypothetical protein